MHPELVPLEDSHPKDGLFGQPLVVSALTASEPEPRDDDQVRVTFRATIKDAEGRRCPDVVVDATIVGPDRTATGSATTDLMGAVRFRMTGPAGTYRLTIEDVAAGGLEWDPAASQTTASAEG